MSIKIIKEILILLLFYFTFGALSAEENLKSVGKFKDWESFVLLQDGNKTCFAQSIPVVRAPKKLKREPSRLFVSFRPAENIKNEVSVTNGYEFKLKAPVEAKSGKKTYDLFSKGKLNGTVHTCIGQEFSGVAVAQELNSDDFLYLIVPSYKLLFFRQSPKLLVLN